MQQWVNALTFHTWRPEVKPWFCWSPWQSSLMSAGPGTDGEGSSTASVMSEIILQHQPRLQGASTHLALSYQRVCDTTVIWHGSIFPRAGIAERVCHCDLRYCRTALRSFLLVSYNIFRLCAPAFAQMPSHTHIDHTLSTTPKSKCGDCLTYKRIFTRESKETYSILSLPLRYLIKNFKTNLHEQQNLKLPYI